MTDPSLIETISDSFAVIQHLFCAAVLLYNELLYNATRRFKVDKLADVHPTTHCEVQVTSSSLIESENRKNCLVVHHSTVYANVTSQCQ